MTTLRRCSPEIERELHDKEDRIRELEAGLRRMLHDPECDYQAVAWDLLAATPPPDSEPNQCDGCRRGLPLGDSGAGRRVRPEGSMEARIRELYDALWTLDGHARLYMTLSGNVDQQVREALTTTDSEPAVCPACGELSRMHGHGDTEPAERGECPVCREKIEDLNWCGGPFQWCPAPPQRRDALEAVNELRAGYSHPPTDGGWFDDRCAVINRALSNPTGEVVVTTNERGDAVTVTRQDEEGEILSVIWERALAQSEQGRVPDIDQSALLERIAQITAHRACCGSEHDPENGKLHGYCVVCGVPWPCEFAAAPQPQEYDDE